MTFPRLLISTFLVGCCSPVFAQQAGESPVKIFILAGQSNMEGKGQILPATTPGTLAHVVANDPEGKYQFLIDETGDWAVREDVWIRDESPRHSGLTVGYGSGTDLVGPEIGFGHFAGDFYDSQVLIVKAAWGGRALATQFRPPSSGWDNPPTSSLDDGFYYTEILRLVEEATTNLGTYFPNYDGQGYEIAGFCWHQGYNDKIDTGRSAEYEANMANFIRDMRDDLNAPGLPFVIATTAQDDSESYNTVERAQLKMADTTAYPEFAGNVVVIDAKQPYDDLRFWIPAEESPQAEGFHWNRNAKTFTNLGLAMAREMIRMVPERCPDLLTAERDGTAARLNWRNGTEMPVSVRILRDGVELAAAAPVDPPTFLDTTAVPGNLNYELQFTMNGTACDPLNLTFNAGVTQLEAIRVVNGIRLNWRNNLPYSGLELRRNGAVLAASLPGSDTTYLDTSPPTTGEITYSLVPTNGTPVPAEVQISIEGLGNALIEEPFADPDRTLGSNPAGRGLQGPWESTTTILDYPNLFFGSLPNSGRSVFRRMGSNATSARVLIGPELEASGLMDDGASLWFSFLTRNVSGSDNSIQLALGTAGIAGSSGIPDLGNAGQAIGVSVNQNGSTQAATWSPTVAAGSASGAIAQGDVGLVVGKITWGADASSPDLVEIFLPATDMAQPASAISSASAVLDQSRFDTLSFSGSDIRLDEIRFAATYDDVIAADVPFVPDTFAPTPNPTTWARPPHAVADSAISMTATNAEDPNGVEYYFQEISGSPGGNDSGWQRSPSFTDGGLDPDAVYTYTVRTRDLSPARNESTNALAMSARTHTLSGRRQAFIYEPFDDSDSNLGNNQTGFGITGLWFAGGLAVVNGESMAYGNLTTKGNRVIKSGGRFVNASADIGPSLNALGLLEHNAEFWFSALMTSENPGDLRRSYFSIGDGPPDGFGRVGSTGLGVNIEEGTVRAWSWTPNSGGTRAPVNDGTVLIVGKITWGAPGTNDRLDVYLPGTDLVLPPAPASSISADYNQSLFTVLGFAGGRYGVSPEIDEIRFGLSYAEVVPTDLDYGNWAANYSATDLSEPAADHDGDGLTNDEERIFGTNPTDPSSNNPIAVAIEPTSGTFTYIRRAAALTGLSYKVWYSTDLENWTEDTGVQQTADSPDADGVETVAVALSGPLRNLPKLFVRVEAEGR